MSNNMSTEPEEFDDEAKALADAIQSTPEESFTSEHELIAPVAKKGSSKVVKGILGLGVVFVIALGGAYFYNDMTAQPPVRKPAMPKLADDVAVKQQATEAPALPTQVPTPVPVQAASAPVQATDPFSTPSSTSQSAMPAAMPTVVAPVEVKVLPKVVESTKTKVVESPNAKVVETVSTPSTVTKKTTAHKSSNKKEDHGYVQLF